ncbi:TlpA disulfide reductase family protein [Ascidiimonas aurantiaca]|uniref:TlpA family protein disulfide reductase n=1 Tax=Ascidiimonas aurantiaca TaxID=1685432 RepID=UPI0030EDC117
MKNSILTITLLLCQFFHAQEIKNFEPVFIVNEKIVSKEKVEEYARKGAVKAMQNGISDEKFRELKKIHGDTLIAKEFVLLIEVYTEEELSARTKKSTNVVSKNTDKKTKKEDGYLLKAGDAAADFTIRMTSGKTVKLSDLKGKVILLNFWATWCAPCIREFYELPSKILEPFKEEDFVFLPIAKGEDFQKVQKKLAALQEKGVIFDSGLDPDEIIWNQYAQGGIPKNFIIDKNGIIQYVATGNTGKSLDTLKEEAEKYLRE